ncbi:ribosome-associated translation inhibitor RaiA [Paroceanicella profunda]|uniref:Ribosome hibernation promoting factor n=1 Tax=Paroceanicella profunda TaxID=2579971 RepID=A0A5B8FG55_9RHOB|nr:ribosome-associated translation inhibitor RaiA [Paroceanicella profunda]QDL90801.1 ribosome-associated translation inhibitor RaiA [Paroceanicella profunda]
MRIQIHGKQLDVGDALRTHVEENLTEAVSKYAERPVEAVVTFSRDRHEFVCDASVHISTGLTSQAKNRATDIYAAFDGCTARMEKQLRRYKRRLKNHHPERNGDALPALDAAYSVLAGGDDEADEPDTLQPIIVAETKTTIRSLSVGEAVMQMEIADAPMLVFRNHKHGGVNVVYRRDDGNIGWIDPRNLPTV